MRQHIGVANVHRLAFAERVRVSPPACDVPGGGRTSIVEDVRESLGKLVAACPRRSIERERRAASHGDRSQVVDPVRVVRVLVGEQHRIHAIARPSR